MNKISEAFQKMCRFVWSSTVIGPIFEQLKNGYHLQSNKLHQEKKYEAATCCPHCLTDRRSQWKSCAETPLLKARHEGGKMKKGKKRNKTGCHGLPLHKGFSFPTHPFLSVRGLLISLCQRLSAQIKVKKRKEKSRAVEDTQYVSPTPSFCYHFSSCGDILFISCFFFHNSPKRKSCCRDVSVCLSPQGAGGEDVGGPTVTCNSALIGVTSPREEGLCYNLSLSPWQSN